MHVRVALYNDDDDDVLDNHFSKLWMHSIAAKCLSFEWLAYRRGDGVLSDRQAITFKTSVVMLTDYMYSWTRPQHKQQQ